MAGEQAPSNKATNSIFRIRRGRFGHAFAADAQHIGDEVLSHAQFVRVQSVKSQEQPPAQLLIDFVMAIANRRLRHLRN